MLENRVFRELLHLKLAFLGDVIEEHVLGKLAGVGKRQNVGVGPHAECVDVASAMVGESGKANPHELPLSELGVLLVEGG